MGDRTSGRSLPQAWTLSTDALLPLPVVALAMSVLRRPTFPTQRLSGSRLQRWRSPPHPIPVPMPIIIQKVHAKLEVEDKNSALREYHQRTAAAIGPSCIVLGRIVGLNIRYFCIVLGRPSWYCTPSLPLLCFVLRQVIARGYFRRIDDKTATGAYSFVHKEWSVPSS